MPYKCCVSGCRSGYSSTSKSSEAENNEKVPQFCFPYDSKLRLKWFLNIHRADLKTVDDITPSMRVCAKHFLPEDFQDDTKRKLKPGAWPRIHPNLPHLNKIASTSRQTPSTSENRREKLNEMITKTNEEILSSGIFTTFDEMLREISDTSFILPTHYQVVKGMNYVTFLFITAISENPVHRASIIISKDLKFSVFVEKKHLPKKQFNHLLEIENQVSSSVEISNLLAFVKSICESQNETSDNSENVIETAANLLESVLLNADISGRENLLSFIISQLRLMGLSSNQYRYNSDMIVTSFQWKMISPALYRKLGVFFILPSIRRLQQLSTGLNVHPAEVDVSYLTSRISGINDKDRFCIMLFDEIYTAAKVEYQSGEFVGLSDDGTIAKTLLVFMVHSIMGKFKDVVKLIPVSRMTTDFLYDCVDNLLCKLGSLGLTILALGADNHPVNR